MHDPGALLERLANQHAIPFRTGSPPAPRQVRAPDGVTLNVLDWGGTGAPVLLLHGGSLTAHTWDLVCLALCDEFRCVAYDLRGHGDSAWAGDYTIDAHVADVAALVSHFGWSQCHLVGMSLGGNIAAHYAAAADSRVASLTMVDVGPNVDFNTTAVMRSFMSRPIADLTLDELVDAAVDVSARGGRDKIFYRYLHMTRMGTDARLAWRQDRRRPHDYAHILGKLQELENLAPSLRCRALIVRGGRSRVLSDEKVAAFASRLRDGRWIVIPEAGHNIQEDEPVALANALRNFLS